MRGDVTGVGNPMDASKDPLADLGNLSALFGTSQPGTSVYVTTCEIQKIVLHFHKRIIMQTKQPMPIKILKIYCENN